MSYGRRTESKLSRRLCSSFVAAAPKPHCQYPEADGTHRLRGALLVASKEETASKRNYAALACCRADSAADPLRYDSICTEGAPASLVCRLAKKELLVWFA